MGDDLMGMLSDMSDPDQEDNTGGKGMGDLLAVSYTHLDVYKRQMLLRL